MATTRTTFICSDCGHAAPKWLGQCPDCQAWNTHHEEIVTSPSTAPVVIGEAPRRITEIEAENWAAASTGAKELDRVLGGGLVAGSVTLLGGEPGIGKSTLLLQAAARVAKTDRRCLYVSAEESSEQVRIRAERLGATVDELWLVAETSLSAVLQHCDTLKPDFLVMDSIQTVHDPDLKSAPGSVSQVRHCAHRLVTEAKRRSMTTVLVGHVTKEGGLAGPRVLEHVVDTVLAFEGDRHHALRLLRANKHRFGSTDELGVFQMTSRGLRSVDDPSELFLADRASGVPGSVVVPTLDGQRPLLVEIQALTAETALSNPRRAATGLDTGRLSQVLAVLQQRIGYGFSKQDVFASAVGGARVHEPAVDLGLALAVVSSLTGEPLDAGLVACGEIGLAGELRQAAHTDRRLAEAARAGFTRAIIPAASPDGPAGIALTRVATLADAVVAAGLSPVVRESVAERRPAAERDARRHLVPVDDALIDLTEPELGEGVPAPF